MGSARGNEEVQLGGPSLGYGLYYVCLILQMVSPDSREGSPRRRILVSLERTRLTTVAGECSWTARKVKEIMKTVAKITTCRRFHSMVPSTPENYLCIAQRESTTSKECQECLEYLAGFCLWYRRTITALLPVTSAQGTQVKAIPMGAGSTPRGGWYPISTWLTATTLVDVVGGPQLHAQLLTS